MSAADSILFMLKEDRPDEQLLEVFDALFGFRIDTPENQVEDAIGVMMTHREDGDFRKSGIVSWPVQRLLEWTTEQVAEKMAASLGVAVAIAREDDQWFLAEPGAKAKAVEFDDEDEGIGLDDD